MSDAKEAKRMMRVMKEIAGKYEMLEKNPAGKRIIDATKVFGKRNPYVRGAKMLKEGMTNPMTREAAKKAYKQVIRQAKRIDEAQKAALGAGGLGWAIGKQSEKKKKK